MSPKYVYFFGNGSADGRSDMKHLLGGKGANLAEMTNLGIPVPPGFTITTEVCDAYYKNNNQYPGGLAKELEQNLSRLEKLMGARLGDPANPLLVSVRSGAAASMPGMMDTVLNLGLTPDAVAWLIKKTRPDPQSLSRITPVMHTDRVSWCCLSRATWTPCIQVKRW